MFLVMEAGSFHAARGRDTLKAEARLKGISPPGVSNTDKPSATTTAVTEWGVKFFEVSSPLLCAHRVLSCEKIKVKVR